MLDLVGAVSPVYLGVRTVRSRGSLAAALEGSVGGLGGLVMIVLGAGPALTGRKD